MESLGKLDLFLIFALTGCITPAFTELQTHHRCLDTVSHKDEPGPEDKLFEQCTPWKNFSCCTHETTSDAHKLKLYNFNFEHCPKKMSEECRKHFVRDLCFYECSPNIGPWIVKVNMKIRRERFFGVPLCQSDCDAWFSACVDDYTCTDNWARNFVWNSTGNQCPPNSQCMKFKDVFKTAKNFCEKVWDGSWEVVSDSLPCMRTWFEPEKGNPNEAVAVLKMQEMKYETDNSSTSTLLASVEVIFACYAVFWSYIMAHGFEMA